MRDQLRQCRIEAERAGPGAADPTSPLRCALYETTAAPSPPAQPPTSQSRTDPARSSEPTSSRKASVLSNQRLGDGHRCLCACASPREKTLTEPANRNETPSLGLQYFVMGVEVLADHKGDHGHCNDTQQGHSEAQSLRCWTHCAHRTRRSYRLWRSKVIDIANLPRNSASFLDGFSRKK
ncbi:hypothetical protein EYF80_050015 [Liparis tanakae]|uniref:Uncharacterized protein n=1 Tax=Liparis tanakae TaxID=230148 RepID=A0A4Z2FF15_9TELE|nr:hypothetical protein EYF80_050015 [Liparis tanakae]